MKEMSNIMDGLRRETDILIKKLDEARVKAGNNKDRAAERNLEIRLNDLRTCRWTEQILEHWDEYLNQPKIKKYLDNP